MNVGTTFALLLRRKWIAFLARCRLPSSASPLLVIGRPLDLLRELLERVRGIEGFWYFLVRLGNLRLEARLLELDELVAFGLVQE